jgi:hypothetical protein
LKKLGIKHLIECHCTLKIFDIREDIQDHLYHKFPVYSLLDENDKLIEKIVQCNNCQTLHKVKEYCKSELVERGSETNITSIDVEDIKFQLSDKLINLLEKYNADISTWEHVLDIVEKEVWNQNVILSRQIIDQKYHVKILKVLSENKFKIITKVLNDEIQL